MFHDVQGLINLYGSDAAFVEKMDSVFSQPATVRPGWYGGKIHEMVEMEEARMGQYAHGNQPIQHMPYLYSYAGQPWKTQYWVRQIMRRLYNSTPDGFPATRTRAACRRCMCSVPSVSTRLRPAPTSM